MARKLRLQYEGAIYHVMNRGDRREAIFQDDKDRLMFLQTLGETCGKTGWRVHAYCLMTNHFHLVVETPRANLVAGMKWFLGTYTGRFNRRHKLFGHLFSGRYKTLIVDGSGNGYLRTVCDYVHLNPVRAKLLRAEEPLQKYQWSSYPEYLRTPTHRCPWVSVERVFGEAGITQDTKAGRLEFGQRMEARRVAENPTLVNAIRRGWCLGDKPFRRELLEQMEQKLGKEHYGEERHETDEQKAETLVQAAFKRLQWTEADLSLRRKVIVAAQLRRETTMTLKWIAQRLQMGGSSNVLKKLSTYAK